MNKKYSLPDEMLNSVSGGKLPVGWQKIADSMAPGLLQKYPGITYEEACEKLKQYITDPEDYAAVSEYIEKYF